MHQIFDVYLLSLQTKTHGEMFVSHDCGIVGNVNKLKGELSNMVGGTDSTSSGECRLLHELDTTAKPRRQFNNPFYYKPDALTLEAVRQLQDHLPTDTEEGKMWGVLIVDCNGTVGFLTAYSGQISDRLRKTVGESWAGCPPVYDYLEEDGLFKRRESEITAVNHHIASLESEPAYTGLKAEYERLRIEADREIEKKRRAMREAKAQRDVRRLSADVTEQELQSMIRQSQFMKAEVHRAKVHYRDLLNSVRSRIETTSRQIETLRRRRKLMSDRLQSWLFNQFILYNARGETKPMTEVFREYYAGNRNAPSSLCPSGAGECCEPKLLQYAYRHGMRPLSMATFWWGPSPANELRRHGNFYPACSGKCKPILSWMLQGLDVEPNPLEDADKQSLAIIYEDDSLAVVDKPSGMLAVPGKSHRDSVVDILARRWNGQCSALAVHRLDMATSGLMVVAKNKYAHKALQKQFKEHTIVKKYTAIVEAVPRTEASDGEAPIYNNVGNDVRTISLPMRPDPMDRPRQMIDRDNGKPAVTLCRVLSYNGSEARLELQPLTGRTHQLRVHCASHLGLNAPIKGDALYGTFADRLYLHACYLEFTHPLTGQRLTFTSPPPF